MGATNAQIRASLLLDEAILAAMKTRPEGIMTYVIANILSMERGYPGIATSRVLARLKYLERAGIVARTPSSYAVQLCWRKLP